MKKTQKLLPAAMMLFCSGLTMAVLTSEAYAGNADCNPGQHKCEAPFTVGKDKISQKNGAEKNYCNPLYHSCEAPFTIGHDHINP
ncbi:hypothetical protein LCD46_08725 [Enterobacter ludwigii]|uniref:hypothetical protein n=1 Tax=unclassified Enterobacter TaxID=2608935 RepID=UPI001ABDD6C6|nr:hypothetical protein [Enterobacter ludwigii]UOY72376.1 hypothetical protein LCD46_08725 [Enterobacter ludwigii]